ncbi:MAG: hypothetical protein OEZ68_06035 [Gammaproteobacteria bacterium]|nr:hypothetical protein [Gammaproteobacteria bacterium]
MNYNGYVFERIANLAKVRKSKYGKDFRQDCMESREIFDELDSLSKNELASIIAIYLLGKENASSKDEAMEIANTLGFEAIDSVAFDVELLEILIKGHSIWCL